MLRGETHFEKFLTHTPFFQTPIQLSPSSSVINRATQVKLNNPFSIFPTFLVNAYWIYQNLNAAECQ